MRTDRRLGLAALALAGCRDLPATSDLRGTLLPQALARPAFVLRTTAGAPFDFAGGTRGRLTLLFFGYTNCPDVCPATMANLGAVLGRLPSHERNRVLVVFVTTDPERDTPERLAAWLRRFDSETIGLTGSVDEVVEAQRAAGVGVAVREPAGDSGYLVSHAAQVMVVSPDDSMHVAYPFGTRQSDWLEDLPKLLARWTGPRR
jgi:protein SCO1/2